jgi:hypothetical protein
MKIDIEKLEKLVTDADKIFLTADGEDVLVQLLDIQKQVELAITAAKIKLEETALKINPNFSSIQSDRIKVYYRSYGARFRIDESYLDQVPVELYSTKVTYSPDVKAIEKYVDEHKGVPLGIDEVERPKQLSISLKGSSSDGE